MPPKFETAGDLIAYLKDTSNDLEAPARVIATEINGVLEAIADEGALLSRMSGSGATCFGLFDNDEAAERAATAMRAQNPRWWVTATTLIT